MDYSESTEHESPIDTPTRASILMNSPCRRGGSPPGVTSHIISSSGNLEFSLRNRPKNTRVCRKPWSGHNVIGEAMKASDDVMASQLREMPRASRDLEKSKIEVQLKLFAEQMDYACEKDCRLYGKFVIANENAHLAILKYGEVVSCLAQLSQLLNRVLTAPKSLTTEKTISTRHASA